MRPTLTLFIFSVSAFFLSFGAYVFSLHFLTTEHANIVSLESQIRQKASAVAQVALTRAAAKQIVEDEAEIRNHFVSTEDIVSYIENLQSTGKSLGATIAVVSITPDPSPTARTMRLTLTLTGTFDAVVRAIGALEYAPYDIATTALTLGSSDKNSWHANMEVEIGLAGAGEIPTVVPTSPNQSTPAGVVPNGSSGGKPRPI